eukprot:TRINITY_DN290_c0_g1_i1.p1 TRINITY_DN290_c0_g1~~TRINITY_DN290_c0_g1_i1.p1  ORF type:complete len:164 (-),score=46.04 TRINITY_DN290_c0_g1_i1:94-585(-)
MSEEGSNVKLFIGSLSFSTTEDSLREAFSGVGDVQNCRVITDRETGKSRGFGFVEFTDKDTAQRAIDEWNNKDLDGRQIKVEIASERGSGGGGRDRRDSPYGGRNRDFGGGRGGRDNYRGNSSRSGYDRNSRGGSRDNYGGGSRDNYGGGRRDNYGGSRRRDD